MVRKVCLVSGSEDPTETIYFISWSTDFEDCFRIFEWDLLDFKESRSSS